MKAKQNDIRTTLLTLFQNRKKLELVLLNELQGRKFKFKKLMKKVKTHAANIKEDKIKDYKEKTEHYKLNQVRINTVLGVGKRENDYANKAISLQSYSELSIFRGPNHLPKPEPALGPFICDRNLQLSNDELLILSKTPKFSVRGEVSKRDMLIEIERMLSKHRYCRGRIVKRKLNGKKVEKKPPETILLETGNRLDTLANIWVQNKDRLIYNELEGTINFTSRRLTDYRHNKSVK